MGDWAIGRLGDWEIGRLVDCEIVRLGDWEIGRLGDWEKQGIDGVKGKGSRYAGWGRKEYMEVRK